MKNIDKKIYIIWIILFFSSVIMFNLLQWSNSFIIIFSWIVLSIGLFNTSWIFFYKSLQIKDEYLRYVFSFLHIVIFTVMSFILIPSMM